ncbi:hypothetical protein NEUTE2DRAFT_65536 [Neurospora tetrasperma FGSC 2509]|nr:hypothetical protein NEUTE2DRAFT_65536 [Neurospora tetrasperma FGSC 2509]
MTDTTDGTTTGTSDAFVDELSTQLWVLINTETRGRWINPTLQVPLITSWCASLPSKRERCTRYWTLHAMAGAGDTCILDNNALHFLALGGRDGRG